MLQFRPVSKSGGSYTPPPSKWSGKLWSSMGDSITAQNQWQPLICSAMGLTNENYGVSGTKVADTGGDANAMCRDERINLIDANSNLITVMGGTNDWAQNVPLGSITDTVTSSFYGALNTLCQKLTTRFPDRRIVLMTTPYGKYPNRTGWSNTYGLLNNLNLTTGDYGQCIINVARLYGFPVIDIYGSAGWNDVNIATYINFDGAYLHPNSMGGARIAEIVIGKLNTITPLS